MSKWRVVGQTMISIAGCIRDVLLVKPAKDAQDLELSAEFEAWEEVSDEALVNFENVLDDNTFDTPSAIGDGNARSHAPNS